MPTTQLQLRRGTTAQTAVFTGATGEVTVDTDKKTLIVHDGVTAGGTEIAKQSYANAAFHQANNASSTASDAYQHASSASSYANSAYAQANTAIYAGSYANSAFIKANSAYAHSNLTYDHAQAAFAAANNAGSTASDAYQHSSSASSYANSAYSVANTADQRAVTSGDYANSAFSVANTKLSSSGGTITGDVTLSSGKYLYADYIHAYHTLSIANNAAIMTGPQPSLIIDGDSGSYGDILTVNTFGFIEWMSPSASSYANGAFAKANTVASDLTSANTWLQSYVNTQVSNLVDSAPTTLDTLNELAAALGDDANFSTSIATMVGTAGDYANSAFLTANTAAASACTATLDAATADQRAVTSGNYANSAFLTANAAVSSACTATLNAATADQRAVTSGDYANSAYTQANTATTSAATADQRAVTSGSYANSAYAKANTGTILAQAAFDAANNSTDTWARTQANTANAKVYVAGSTLTTNTANQVIDSYSTTEYRTAKYIVQAISGADVHSEELLVTHNDTNVFFTEYAVITTANSLFNVYATIQSANVTVNVSPVSADTQIDFSRISIVARSLGSLEGDLMSLSGTEDLETGSGTVDLNA